MDMMSYTVELLFVLLLEAYIRNCGCQGLHILEVTSVVLVISKIPYWDHEDIVELMSPLADSPKISDLFRD